MGWIVWLCYSFFSSPFFLYSSIIALLRYIEGEKRKKKKKAKGKKYRREKFGKSKRKKMVIADAVLFVRKQISRARGSIQIVAVFIWEFYKWLYVIARILVRYVTGIIVFQIVPQLARKFCCSYSQWNWKTREWDVGDKTNWYKKLSKNKNQKKMTVRRWKKKEKRKKNIHYKSLSNQILLKDYFLQKSK